VRRREPNEDARAGGEILAERDRRRGFHAFLTTRTSFLLMLEGSGF